MTEHHSTKLAVLIHADVVGSTRLVQRNEAIAHSRIRDAFSRFSTTIKRYGGAVHELRGDALVAEFARASDAVSAALAFQAGNERHNETLSDDIRPALRVGISMGEVVIADGTITGAGVVLAQRLEQLAAPNGIVVQGSVSETVPPRFPIEFESLGEQRLKGFDHSFRAFIAKLKSGEQLPETETDVALRKYWTDTSVGHATLELPDKPSIAVLPFSNMSGDSEQEYFADGITEDIITELSKFRWFFVIARNSTFALKGQALDLRQVGHDLGVRYVLEGSVRKAANRVRVTAQLIDAETGKHVWAERYDRSLDDIFELQDEITATIAGAIEPELAGSERKRALRKPTENLGAWDLMQRGVALIWQQERTSLLEGLKTIRKAVTLDPGFGEAYGYLAYGAFLLLVYEWTDETDVILQQGTADANRAITIDHRDYFAHHALGRLNTIAGNHRAAIRALEKSVDLNPNFVLGYDGLAEAHVYGGSPEAAISYADKAIRLSPRDPMFWDFLHYKASAFIRLDDFDRAIELFEQVCEFPTAQYVSSATLAALYCIRNRVTEAEKALDRARLLEPGLSIKLMKKVYGVTDERSGSRAQRLLEALRTTGLAEE